MSQGVRVIGPDRAQLRWEMVDLDSQLPALPEFIATMSAVTPARRRGLVASSALLQPCRSPCFAQSAFRALCLQPPTRSHGRFST